MKRQSVAFQSTLGLGDCLAARTLSRPASPTGQQGPSAKKRKSNGPKVPTGLAMTRLETLQPSLNSQMKPSASATTTAATSPFSPELPSFPVASPESLFPPPSAASAVSTAQPVPNGSPPSSVSNDAMFFPGGNGLAMAQMYSAPTSARPSRASSPNGLRNSVSTMQQQQAQLAQTLQSGLFTLPMGNGAANATMSIINKIIPSEGPKSGGIEVTVLGSGFYQGLDVMFGEQKATTTTFWGENSLVCLVPPSAVAGPVQGEAEAKRTLNHTLGEPVSSSDT